MSDTTASTKKGTIIVDTSALTRMSVPISEEFLTEEAKNRSRTIRFTDALIFLSQHGYEIIIPEIVALQCGRFMRDGQSISQYYTEDAPYDKSAADFLSSIDRLRKQGCNIRIQRPHSIGKSPELDNTESNVSKQAAEYVRQLWNIHRQPISSPGKNKLMSQLDAAFQGRHSWYLDKTPHYATAAIQELIRRMPAQESPIFLLCRDKTRGNIVNEACRLNDYGLISAMHANQLLTEIGIAPASIDESHGGLERLFSDINKKMRGHEVKSTWAEDSPPINAGDVKQLPFAYSLSSLAIVRTVEVINCTSKEERA